MRLLGKGDAGFALDLKFLTLELCWIIRRKVDCWAVAFWNNLKGAHSASAPLPHDVLQSQFFCEGDVLHLCPIERGLMGSIECKIQRVFQ